MADVANLEVRIDSSQARAATKAFKPLTAAAKEAARAAKELADASKAAAAAKKEMAAAAKAAAKTEKEAARASAQSTKEAAKAAKEIERAAKDAAQAIINEGKAFDKAAKKANAVAREQRRVAKAAKDMSKDVDFATKQMLALGAAFAALRLAQDAIKVFVDFETTMASLQGTLGVTEMAMAGLTAQAKELGATTKFSAAQAGEAQLALARSGQSQNEVLRTTAEVLNLAAAANIELGTAAEITAKSMAQFSLSAAEAQRVTDVLVQTANRANTDVTKLAEALSQGGVIASKVGKSIEETAAAIGVLGNAGIEAGAAGTNLRGVIAALLGPTGKAAAQLRELAERSGQTTKAFDITENSIADVFKAFSRAGATSAELLNVFGRINVTAASVFTSSTEELAKLEAQLSSSGTEGAAQRFADTMNDTLGGAMLSLRSSVEALFISLGESGLATSFRDVIEAATIVVRGLAGIEDATQGTSVRAQALAKILKLLVFIFKAYTAGLIATAVKTVAVRVATVGFSASLVGLRVALISTGVGALVVGLGTLIAHFSSAESEVAKMVREMNELEDQNKDTKKSIDAVTEAIRKQETQTKTALERAKEYRESQFTIAREIRGLRESIVNFNPVLESLGLNFADLNREGSKVAALFLETERAAGRAIGPLALARARDLSSGYIALQIELAGTRKEYEELGKAQKSVNDSAKPDRIQEFFDKLNDSVTASFTFEDVERRLDKLRQTFITVFEDAPEKARKKFGDLDVLIKEIESSFRTIESNNSLARAFKTAETASESLNKSLEDAQRTISGGLGGRSEAAIIQDEYRDALKSANDALDEQVASQGRTAESSKELKAELAGVVDATVAARVAALRLDEANESFGAFSERIAEIADADLDEFPASLREASDAIKELGKLRADAEATLAALDPANLKSGEFGTRMDDIATAYEDGIKRLKIQGTVSELKAGTDQMVDNFGAAFTEIAAGAEDVRQVFQDLGANLLSTALQSFVIEPVLDQLKEGIGQALAEARGLANKGIEKASEVTAAAAVETSAVSVGTAAAGLTTSAGVVTTSATLMGTSAAALGTAGGVVTASAAAITASAAALATAAAAAGAVAVGGAVAGAAANGAVVSSGAMMFAQGGVIDSPMSFPLRGGSIGIAGEAGPEAILPARKMGGGFEVEASIGGGETTTVPVRRLNSGKLGVKLFRHGGVVDTGAERTASLAQPTSGGRVFPAATEERTNVRNQSVVLNIATPNPQAFERSSRQMRRRMQSALR